MPSARKQSNWQRFLITSYEARLCPTPPEQQAAARNEKTYRSRFWNWHSINYNSIDIDDTCAAVIRLELNGANVGVVVIAGGKGFAGKARQRGQNCI